MTVEDVLNELAREFGYIGTWKEYMQYRFDNGYPRTSLKVDFERGVELAFLAGKEEERKEFSEWLRCLYRELKKKRLSEAKKE